MNNLALPRTPRIATRGLLVVVTMLAALGVSRSGAATSSAAGPAPLARVDLTTATGVASLQGSWRYHDARLVDTRFPLPGAEGQPTGPEATTQIVEPAAGARDFQDQNWPVITPESLATRRGGGRASFGWYRFEFTVPERIDGIDVRGTTAWLQLVLDDYAEVWVDGELGRASGQAGGSVVAGWNAPNRLVIGRNLRPGQRIQLAIFGMNGPVSDAPTNYIYVREAGIEFHAAPEGPVALAAQEVNVRIERTSPEFDAIVPRNAKLFKLAEGFQFTEGPVWIRQGGYLLFSDPNRNRVYRYDPREGGRLDVYREHSGYEGADIAEFGQPGSNGLTVDRQGRLTLAEHGRHRVSRLEPDGRLSTLADRFAHRRLNSPNDLVYRSDGSLYFTDPPFGLPKFYDDPRRELRFSGVYRWSAGKLTALVRDLKGPNGIAFAPDESILYVGNWDPAAKTVTRYPVSRNGALGRGETFVDLTARIPGDEALDGIKVDVRGNVYVSAPGGLWVFDARGHHLGTITAPRPIHNFAWGGDDGRTLYLCARSALYRIPLLVEGVRP
jgi:gluconolactonase